ncbi:ATP-binding protein [Thermosulfurimonas marina]|uniref:ATP-binding protein n=1 Tax=Thermosulfurimonas marina TaxID=2047767 RepID=A0A6H1WQM5_9BACT|nr:ATP-binding protein [Thermosulfurimonas marina]QJA05460.1 ATP-binding protein [Thermosulfurimonas marina]
MYRKRWLAEKIRKALEFFPVVAVVGARQTGKSTLVQQEFPERTYFTLDSPEVRSVLEEDPYGFLSAQKGPLTLDEVQKVPALFEALKLLVDRNREPGRFLLTGSANFLLLKRVSESLAGRIAIFELPGFMVSEAEGYPPPGFLKDCLQGFPSFPEKIPSRPPLETLIARGGFPPAVLAPDEETRRWWFENYLATYLERDLRDLSQVASLGDFRRLMGLAALRTAQVLNLAELARDAGLSPSTARNYLQLLEISYQVRRLAPFFAHLGKRLTKAPKLYFRDTGLALVLAGIAVRAPELIFHPFYPALVESFLVEEIIKLLSFLEPRARIYYFRTHAGAEVDLVVELGERLLPIEIKASTQISPRKLAGLKQFLKDFSHRAPFGLVVYLGEEVLALSPGIYLVPWRALI